MAVHDELCLVQTQLAGLIQQALVHIAGHHFGKEQIVAAQRDPLGHFAFQVHRAFRQHRAVGEHAARLGMQAAGGKFVLSTGRGYCVINKQQLGGIRFDYVIANNGACVVDRDGAIIAEHPMTNEEMYALVDFCEDYNYPLQFNFRDGYYAYCEYESLRDFYAQLSGSGLTCKDGEDQDRHLIDMPHAAFACLPDEALEAFNRKYGHLNLRFMMVGAVREGSWHCYDIVREGIDKGVGLADLCETVGLTLADAVSVGDSANDVGMLKAAGLGCCMANGSDDAKEAADRIIGDVREDGLAALIEELWFNGPRAEPSGHELGSPWGQMEAAEEKQ